MRKITLVLALVVAAVAVQAQSGIRNNAVKLNPLSLAFLTGNVAYERAVAPSQSVQVGVFFSGFSLGGLKYNGMGITPEYRFYVGGQKEALNGLYVAPFARYQNFSLKDKETEDKATLSSIGGGAILGWQKMWPRGFTLDLFAGPAYNSGKVKADEANDDQFDVKAGISGFGVRAGITLGLGF